LSKNIVIFSLIAVIVFLMGVILLTNFALFSEGWVVGLGIIISTIVSGIVISLKKIKNKF